MPTVFRRDVIRRLNESEERLTLDGEALPGARLLDFFVWAYTDLCDDVIEGIFAEWMVAKLLGINTRRRYEWANSDLYLPRERRST